MRGIAWNPDFPPRKVAPFLARFEGPTGKTISPRWKQHRTLLPPEPQQNSSEPLNLFAWLRVRSRPRWGEPEPRPGKRRDRTDVPLTATAASPSNTNIPLPFLLPQNYVWRAAFPALPRKGPVRPPLPSSPREGAFLFVHVFQMTIQPIFTKHLPEPSASPLPRRGAVEPSLRADAEASPASPCGTWVVRAQQMMLIWNRAWRAGCSWIISTWETIIIFFCFFPPVVSSKFLFPSRHNIVSSPLPSLLRFYFSSIFLINRGNEGKASLSHCPVFRASV